MARGAFVKVQGLAALKRRFGKIPEHVNAEVDALLQGMANEFVDRAVNAVPTDRGLLKVGISAKKAGELKYQIVSSAPYSAFVEWGTRSRAKIPADQVSYAATFKGKGAGSGKGFYDSILDWVRRTGLAATYSVKTRKKVKNLDTKIAEEQAAMAIYLSILRHGSKPHPFFFPQLEKARADVKKLVDPAIQKALRK